MFGNPAAIETDPAVECCQSVGTMDLATIVAEAWAFLV